MEMSPEYAEAKARVAKEKTFTLRWTLLAPPMHYSLAIVWSLERLANGNYRPPKLKDVTIKRKKERIVEW